MRGGAGFEIASMRLRFLKYAQHARGVTAAKVFRQFNALKSLYLFNRRVLWPSFDHNVRAQQQPRTLGRSPLLARAKDQTFTAFPLTRLENQPPAYLIGGTAATSLNIKQCTESSETQSNASCQEAFREVAN
jgi:hypothetical protein